MFVVLGKIICVGRNVGGGELRWGLFSNFFCTFGTVTINAPPLYCLFSTRWGSRGSLDQHCPVELSAMI